MLGREVEFTAWTNFPLNYSCLHDLTCMPFLDTWNRPMRIAELNVEKFIHPEITPFEITF